MATDAVAPIEAAPIEIDRLSAWVDLLTARTANGDGSTIGLISGSPSPMDGRILAELVLEVAQSLSVSPDSKRLLVVKLDVFRSRNLDRAPDQPATIPVAMRSPLGHWSEVTIPIPVGARASWSLEQIPAWLPKWKCAFDLVLVDLGPLDLVPSRVVGRMCDYCYVVLGPKSASAEWIARQMDWHQQSGSSICGTLVSTLQRVA